MNMFKQFIMERDAGNRVLLALGLRDIEALRERWLDEAADAALNGNPRRAQYLYTLCGVA